MSHLVSRRRAIIFSYGVLFAISSNDRGSASGLETTPTSPLFHVAPMQCYTNRHFRYLCRQLSASSVLWTEMEKVEDVVACPDSLRDSILDHNGRRCSGDHVLQLGGNDPSLLSIATEMGTMAGYSEINLNVGCPSIKTGGSPCYGAALMRDPSRVRSLLEAMAAATTLPVSIKCRIGIHERMSSGPTHPEDRYETLADFVDTVTSGCQVKRVHVHARSAVLGGLSPVKNRSVPPLRPDMVHRLARDFPHLSVTLNGGLQSVQDVRDLIELRSDAAEDAQEDSVIEGAMAGRWLLRAPLDLLHVEHALQKAARQPDSKLLDSSAVTALRKYGEYAATMVEERHAAVCEVVLPLLLVAEQLKEIDEQVGEFEEKELHSNFAAVYDSVHAIASGRGIRASECGTREDTGSAQLPHRKLRKEISRLMGKKVCNKASRNRAENLI